LEKGHRRIWRALKGGMASIDPQYVVKRCVTILLKDPFHNGLSISGHFITDNLEG
jgi:hypothetical protein